MLNFDEDFKNFDKNTSYISVMTKNADNLEVLGIAADAEDTIFGADYVFCGSHRAVHSVGWCTVDVMNKRPLRATERNAAHDEAVALNLI